MPITDGKEVSSSVFAKMRKNEIGVLVNFVWVFRTKAGLRRE